MSRVRGARPGSVETRHQETALDIFEKHLGDKRKKREEENEELGITEEEKVRNANRCWFVNNMFYIC